MEISISSLVLVGEEANERNDTINQSGPGVRLGEQFFFLADMVNVRWLSINIYQLLSSEMKSKHLRRGL